MDYQLIYLHGFLSSPQSVKAQQTVAFIDQYFPHLNIEVPQLSNYPGEAAQQVEDVVKKHRGKRLRFIGSSMGGFLSTHFVEKYGGKGVLINPAVKPYALLKDYLGDHENPYTGQRFTLTNQHLDELLALDTPTLQHGGDYWVLLQQGDETLDYRQAEAKYQGAKLTIEPDGDHSFVGYERFLTPILDFLISP
ncbi:alpha/beta hydrolase [Aestuariibacter halophilus]|uniref:Alpha/beta hydrolase n=1 Tax=Fluctibacter halophilus TaxID=226011 RepID=A0ABS8GBH2_9ALTE|nr:YqiA/YcfP family alpha/beta fold hydrolase [Aestuariibacter halophilus]MCC2617932.1 alpha/beta hydrolase [Aestuariibacter halophilus]